MSNQVSAPDPPPTRPLEEIQALRRDLEGVEVPRRLWRTIRLRLFISTLRKSLSPKEDLPRPGHGKHRRGRVPGQDRFGVVPRLHRVGLASVACFFVVAWVGLSGSIIDQRQALKTRVEAKGLGGVSARVQAWPLKPGPGNPLGEASQRGAQTLAQGVQGVQVNVGALLPGRYLRGGSPDLVSLVGMESLAMLGLPYLGPGDLASSAATRSGEWITLPGGGVSALRILD
jgi:hypothetical protein